MQFPATLGRSQTPPHGTGGSHSAAQLTVFQGAHTHCDELYHCTEYKQTNKQTNLSPVVVTARIFHHSDHVITIPINGVNGFMGYWGWSLIEEVCHCWCALSGCIFSLRLFLSPALLPGHHKVSSPLLLQCATFLPYLSSGRQHQPNPAQIILMCLEGSMGINKEEKRKRQTRDN